MRRVIQLLLVNLALALLMSVLLIVFRNDVLAYRLAHMRLPAGVNPQSLRAAQVGQVTQRAISVLVVSVVYAFLIRRLLAGQRRAYRRVVWISGAGLVGLAFLFALEPEPAWMRAEQVVQAVVLASLLWSVTRPQVRARFAPTPAKSP